MKFDIENIGSRKFIGLVREFDSDTSFEKIPVFWNEFSEKYMSKVMGHPENAFDDISLAVARCCIGKYGICIDQGENGRFRYMIAGDYDGCEIPSGLEVFECPALTAARFECTGPVPGAMQSVYKRIFNEWLPVCDYEISHSINIEWYDNADPSSADYKSAILIPVAKKKHL